MLSNWNNRILAFVIVAALLMFGGMLFYFSPTATAVTDSAGAAIDGHTALGYLTAAIEKKAHPPMPQPVITLDCTPVHLVQPGGEISSQICKMPDGATECLYMGYPDGWACYPIPTGATQ